MIKTLVSAARFFWMATAGHRLRPWRSEYLRWRVETYTGKPAATLRLRDFLELLLSERRQMGSFFAWMSDIRALANGNRQ